MTDLPNGESVLTLPGVGPATAAALEAAGIRTVQDLLDFFPVRYKDYTSPRPLGEADGEPHLYFAIVDGPPRGTWVHGRHILNFRVRDGESGAVAQVRLFNQPYLLSALKPDSRVYLDGTAREAGSELRFAAPRVMTKAPQAAIEPVYRSLTGVAPARLRRAVLAALGRLSRDDPYSEDFRSRYGIMGLREAYTAVHAPATMAEQEFGRRRFDFESGLVTTRSLDLVGVERTGENDKVMDARSALDLFTARLPFAPTEAQQRAMLEIASDLEGDQLMNRLLEGDVGSGKTAVALFAMFAARQEGYQSFLLTPTEVLAEQHARTARELFGSEAVLLTGSMSAAARREASSRIASGSAFYIVGTQALLYGGLEAVRPGLIVTDEQHRFGVRQRRTLLGDYGEMHSLIMSATPIPRSLALALSGTTKISLLDELPPGRQPVSTRFVPRRRVPDMYAFLAKKARRGEQVYIVCPLVDSDGESRLHSAEATFRELGERYPDLPVGLLHGRLPPADKQKEMEKFRRGETRVLVATTVIEVGLDVPGATVMVVHDADRFGLAQLHQLRGRVGRGNLPSWCFLTSDSLDARPRLDILCRTQNGFDVAEADMRERGVGEVLGLRQHGRGPGLIDIRETWMIERFREILNEMARDPRLRGDYQFVARQAQELLDGRIRDIVLN